MIPVRDILGNAALKALVADFLLTLATTLGVYNVSPASLRDLLDAASIITFAVLIAAGKAIFRAVLKWASN